MSKPTIPPNPPTTINPQALQNPDAIYEAFCSLIRSCQLKYCPMLIRRYSRHTNRLPNPDMDVVAKSRVHQTGEADRASFLELSS